MGFLCVKSIIAYPIRHAFHNIGDIHESVFVETYKYVSHKNADIVIGISHRLQIQISFSFMTT